MHKIKNNLLGFVAGIFNGFFGAGGGLLVVPMLESLGIEPRKAHATSIAIILPLSIISATVCIIKGVTFKLHQLVTLTSFGVIGAVIGSALLVKIPSKIIKRIFGVIMIISSIRILLK